MLTNFAKLSEDALYNMMFDENTWNTVGDDGCLELLQEVENRQAFYDGRPPMTIRFISAEEEGGGLRGYYQHGRGCLFISRTLVRPSKLGVSGTGAAGAIGTALHEGRHAFQHHCMEKTSSLVNWDQRLEWALNFTHYFSFDGHDSEQEAALYLFQPVELDARRAARQGVRKIGDRLVQAGHAPNPMIRRYLENEQSYERAYAAMAMRVLTPQLLDRLDREAKEKFLRYNPGVDVSRIQLFRELRNMMGCMDRLIDDPRSLGNVSGYGPAFGSNGFNFGTGGSMVASYTPTFGCITPAALGPISVPSDRTMVSICPNIACQTEEELEAMTRAILSRVGADGYASRHGA